MITDVEELLWSLSDKQRQVLDLLIQYKTSKEIAIIIGISHHTVDQHIHASKIKLGALHRNELARFYRQLVSMCQQATYEDSRIAKPAMPFDDFVRFEPEHLLIRSNLALGETPAPEKISEDNRLRLRLSGLRREMLTAMGAIGIIALLLAASLPDGIAAFEKLLALVWGPP